MLQNVFMLFKIVVSKTIELIFEPVVVTGKRDVSGEQYVRLDTLEWRSLAGLGTFKVSFPFHLIVKGQYIARLLVTKRGQEYYGVIADTNTPEQAGVFKYLKESSRSLGKLLEDKEALWNRASEMHVRPDVLDRWMKHRMEQTHEQAKEEVLAPKPELVQPEGGAIEEEDFEN